jgi:hypothetical protein
MLSVPYIFWSKMNFKKIIFVIICTTSLSLGNSYPFDFLHKKETAQSSGLKKIAIGSALFIPGLVNIGDSPIAKIISNSAGISGAAIGLTGAAQIVAEYLCDEQVRKDLNIPGYDSVIKKLFTDKRFLAGAASGAIGFLLYTFRESPQTPDAAKYATIIGLALMGEKIGEQLINNYWSYLMSQINK